MKYRKMRLKVIIDYIIHDAQVSLDSRLTATDTRAPVCCITDIRRWLTDSDFCRSRRSKAPVAELVSVSGIAVAGNVSSCPTWLYNGDVAEKICRFKAYIRAKRSRTVFDDTLPSVLFSWTRTRTKMILRTRTEWELKRMPEVNKNYNEN